MADGGHRHTCGIRSGLFDRWPLTATGGFAYLAETVDALGRAAAAAGKPREGVTQRVKVRASQRATASQRARAGGRTLAGRPASERAPARAGQHRKQRDDPAHPGCEWGGGAGRTCSAYRPRGSWSTARRPCPSRTSTVRSHRSGCSGRPAVGRGTCRTHRPGRQAPSASRGPLRLPCPPAAAALAPAAAGAARGAGRGIAGCGGARGSFGRPYV